MESEADIARCSGQSGLPRQCPEPCHVPNFAFYTPVCSTDSLVWLRPWGGGWPCPRGTQKQCHRWSLGTSDSEGVHSSEGSCLPHPYITVVLNNGNWELGFRRGGDQTTQLWAPGDVAVVSINCFVIGMLSSGMAEPDVTGSFQHSSLSLANPGDTDTPPLPAHLHQPQGACPSYT